MRAGRARRGGARRRQTLPTGGRGEAGETADSSRPGNSFKV
jgi:hypothetical protein